MSKHIHRTFSLLLLCLLFCGCQVANTVVTSIPDKTEPEYTPPPVLTQMHELVPIECSDIAQVLISKLPTSCIEPPDDLWIGTQDPEVIADIYEFVVSLSLTTAPGYDIPDYPAELPAGGQSQYLEFVTHSGEITSLYFYNDEMVLAYGWNYYVDPVYKFQINDTLMGFLDGYEFVPYKDALK